MPDDLVGGRAPEEEASTPAVVTSTNALLCARLMPPAAFEQYGSWTELIPGRLPTGHCAAVAMLLFSWTGLRVPREFMRPPLFRPDVYQSRPPPC
eukprot:833155-Alexandrium_andersonii.AAC.1